MHVYTYIYIYVDRYGTFSVVSVVSKIKVVRGHQHLVFCMFLHIQF